MTGLLATKPRPVDVPGLAEAALWQELELTPKPGLVDKLNNGSHRASFRSPTGFCPAQRPGFGAADYPPDGDGLRAGDVRRDERREHA